MLYGKAYQRTGRDVYTALVYVSSVNKISSMQCVILAAGKGTRMGKVSESVPKPMVRVCGRPVLEYKIHVLPEDVTEIVFVVGYKCDHIMNYFGSYYAGHPIRYALQEELAGTAAALHVARPFLGERFMVLMGDDLYARADLKKLAQERLAILGYHHDNAYGKGVIVADEQGCLTEVCEQFPDKAPGLVNAAAYMLTREFFDYTPVSANNGHAREVGLPQTLAQMTDRHTVVIHRASAWLQITTPEDIDRAQKQISLFL